MLFAPAAGALGARTALCCEAMSTDLVMLHLSSCGVPALHYSSCRVFARMAKCDDHISKARSFVRFVCSTGFHSTAPDGDSRELILSLHGAWMAAVFGLILGSLCTFGRFLACLTQVSLPFAVIIRFTCVCERVCVCARAFHVPPASSASAFSPSTPP